MEVNPSRPLQIRFRIKDFHSTETQFILDQFQRKPAYWSLNSNLS